MDLKTKEFYDEYWPKNVPIYEETEKYVLDTVSERNIGRVFDAGCGHGLCSIVFSKVAEHVTATDLSSDSLDTAQEQARRHNCNNITFIHEDLQACSQPDDSFDLVWCWGVAMMAPDPIKVLEHLMRVTKPGGVIYLGVYLKTWLSPIHQGVRHFCRIFMNGPRRRRIVCNFFATLTHLICYVRGEEINIRSDNLTIQAQVEDWYYAPYKTFYTVEQIAGQFSRNGFAATCIQQQLGRMRSATIFVTKGIKKQTPEDGIYYETGHDV